MTDTLLVLVTLLGTPGPGRVVTAVLRPDSTLMVPAADLHELLGLPAPTSLWTTPAELEAAFPAITVTWLPRELRVVVNDPLAVLPASQAARAQRTRQSVGTGYVPMRSGPFVSFLGDDLGRSLVETGYSYRGMFAASLRHSSTRGDAWSLSIAPASSVFLSYSDGTRGRPQASARMALGSAWTYVTWTPDAWHADALLQLGRWSALATTRDVYAVTYTAPPVALQLGQTGSRTTVRVTYGPILPSPFLVPSIP